MNLTKEEKQFLLKTARQSIKSLFTEVDVVKPDYEKYPVMKENAGAFVTLTINSRLRGCIGYIISENHLYQTVCDAAKQAATQDPRFPPLSENELDNLDMEISVLSQPFKMNGYDDIEIGKHGLIVDEMDRRGLLLPQVPVEHNMNKEEYLTAICQKAGLPKFLWKEKTLNLDLFTAIIFSEKEYEV